MRFFSVSNMMEAYQTPIAAEQVENTNGWFVFSTDNHIVLAIPPDYWFFTEIDEEAYIAAVNIMETEEDNNESVG